ncbi:SPASM domain-containing protein [Streptomyces sp. 2RAF24]|uniref:SPASM domain-containing protein n=1 Tax=Streptomyces sp. 2RAF24 TaxID=3232997 RepID=UPI003F9D6657
MSTIRRLRGLGLKCDHVFTLYPDGRLGSCDELPWPQAQLTRLDQPAGEPDIVAAQRRLPLLNQGKDLMGRCIGCSYRSACGGGCIATRWRPDGRHDSRLCRDLSRGRHQPPPVLHRPPPGAATRGGVPRAHRAGVAGLPGPLRAAEGCPRSLRTRLRHPLRP